MSHKKLKIKNGEINTSVNEMFKEILKSGKVQTLLIPQEVPSKKMVFHVLISDPEKLHADIFAPILASSTATIVSKMTKVEPANKPIAVVIRPCQIRALTELVKLNQANLQNIIIIGVDCPGTFSIKTYSDFPEKKKPTDFLIESINKKNKDYEKYLRTPCYICKEPIPVNADIIIGLYGTDIEKELLIEAKSDNGKKIIDTLKLEDVLKRSILVIQHLKQYLKKNLRIILSLLKKNVKSKE